MLVTTTLAPGAVHVDYMSTSNDHDQSLGSIGIEACAATVTSVPKLINIKAYNTFTSFTQY